MIRQCASARVADERIPWYLMAFGIGLGLVMLAEVVLFLGLGIRDVSDGAFLVGTITSIPFLFGVTYSAYWLLDSDVSPSRYARVVLWGFGGLCAFFLMNASLVAVMPTDSWAEAFSWLRWSVALGTGVGVFIGVMEGRAIQRAIAAERAVVRTQQVEQQRDMLDYLNSILRHEVLNTATAIDGYATRLLEEGPELDDESQRWLEIIRDETDDMACVIDDVRVLLHRTTGDHELRRVDVGAVVEDEVRDLRNECESVAVETDVPDVVVRADDMLPRVFGNLLSNAVEHNDEGTPHVRVTGERTSDAVRIEIADDGPGIPEQEIDSLFERHRRQDTTHGLGLYLVDELLENYDGAIELVETGPGGTTFAVELPRAVPEFGAGAERTAV